ncbi:hypothetical protein D3C72_2225200 [compost metagenome]
MPTRMRASARRPRCSPPSACSAPPISSRLGESQCRSTASSRATRLVPTSAPSITASAMAVVMKPCPAIEAVIRAVAVLLCTAMVAATPAKKAASRLRVP